MTLAIIAAGSLFLICIGFVAGLALSPLVIAHFVMRTRL